MSGIGGSILGGGSALGSAAAAAAPVAAPDSVYSGPSASPGGFGGVGLIAQGLGIVDKAVGSLGARSRAKEAQANANAAIAATAAQMSSDSSKSDTMIYWVIGGVILVGGAILGAVLLFGGKKAKA